MARSVASSKASTGIPRTAFAIALPERREIGRHFGDRLEADQAVADPGSRIRLACFRDGDPSAV
jgi:hypothetical protein